MYVLRVCMYVCMYVSMDGCMYVCKYVCVFCMYVYVCLCMYVCMYVRGRADKFCLHLNRKWTEKDTLIKSKRNIPT